MESERTPQERLAEIVERRAQLERDRIQLAEDIRELVRTAQGEPELSVAAVAEALKLSRQRLYQIAA